MTKYTGAALSVSFNGSLIPANYLKSSESTETGGTAESTGVGNTKATHLPTTNKTTVSLDMWDDATDATMWLLCVPGTTGILLIYPQGVGIGLPKETCATTICTGRGQGAAFNGVMPMTATFDCSGGLTDGTQ